MKDVKFIKLLRECAESISKYADMLEKENCTEEEQEEATKNLVWAMTKLQNTK